jgi:hypothetical protein
MIENRQPDGLKHEPRADRRRLCELIKNGHGMILSAQQYCACQTANARTDDCDPHIAFS